MNLTNNVENRAKMLQIADEIQGTSRNIDDLVEEHFGDGVQLIDLDIQLLELLDDQVMECQGCSWWCETGELNDDQVCSDCDE